MFIPWGCPVGSMAGHTTRSGDVVLPDFGFEFHGNKWKPISGPLNHRGLWACRQLFKRRLDLTVQAATTMAWNCNPCANSKKWIKYKKINWICEWCLMKPLNLCRHNHQMHRAAQLLTTKNWTRNHSQNSFPLVARNSFPLVARFTRPATDIQPSSKSFMVIPAGSGKFPVATAWYTRSKSCSRKFLALKWISSCPGRCSVWFCASNT